MRPHDWIVHADSDEFHRYPGGDLHVFLANVASRGHARSALASPDGASAHNATSPRRALRARPRSDGRLAEPWRFEFSDEPSGDGDDTDEASRRRRLRGESAARRRRLHNSAKSRESAAAAPAADGERADRVNVVLGVLRDRLSACVCTPRSPTRARARALAPPPH